MKRIALAAALLIAFAVPAAAQDVTPAIDPGLAGTAAANREALDRNAAGAGERHRADGTRARRGAARYGRRTVAERRALRRSRRQAAMGY